MRRTARVSDGALRRPRTTAIENRHDARKGSSRDRADERAREGGGRPAGVAPFPRVGSNAGDTERREARAGRRRARETRYPERVADNGAEVARGRFARGNLGTPRVSRDTTRRVGASRVSRETGHTRGEFRSLRTSNFQAAHRDELQRGLGDVHLAQDAILRGGRGRKRDA